MLTLPVSPVPSQVLGVSLANQACKIKIYSKETGLFIDLYVNDALVIAGVSCLNKNRIVRSAYLGFIGDLAFFDLHGNDDPDYTQLGSRFILIYLEAADLP